MPRNFSPADTQTVIDHAVESVDWVYDAKKAGSGVVVVVRSEVDYCHGFNFLMEKFGWYVDKVFPREGGDYYLIMPITEVPE